MRLAAPVVPLFREIAEMRYLWQQPVRITNEKLVARLGAEPHTPLADAVQATLLSRCLIPSDAEVSRPAA